jgi:hypothetical protein
MRMERVQVLERNQQRLVKRIKQQSGRVQALENAMLERRQPAKPSSGDCAAEREGFNYHLPIHNAAPFWAAEVFSGQPRYSVGSRGTQSAAEVFDWAVSVTSRSPVMFSTPLNFLASVVGHYRRLRRYVISIITFILSLLIN